MGERGREGLEGESAWREWGTFASKCAVSPSARRLTPPSARTSSMVMEPLYTARRSHACNRTRTKGERDGGER